MTPVNSDPQPQKFARRSDTESICIFCSLKIESDRYVPLEEAEDIHSDVCLARPDAQLRYTLL